MGPGGQKFVMYGKLTENNMILYYTTYLGNIKENHETFLNHR